ncbi:MAG: sulfurtransferase TusA family protein [Halobacterium sp.]
MAASDVPTEAPDVEPDHTIDNRDRGCANGIVRVQRALEDLHDGAVLRVQSSDRRAKTEYPKLAAQTPHELLAVVTERRRVLAKQYTTYLEVHHE